MSNNTVLKKTLILLLIFLFGFAIFSLAKPKYNKAATAIKKKDYAKLEKIISNNFDINSKNGTGQNLLFAAIDENDVQAAKILIDKGIDLNAKDDNLFMPMAEAMMLESNEIAELLIESGVKRNDLYHKSDYSVLNVACTVNNLIGLKLLVDNGWDVNQKGKSNKPAIFSTIEPDNYDCFLYLLEKGASIHDKTANNGDTLLTFAAFYGRINFAKVLIEKGIAIDAQNDLGETALATAAFKNYTDIAKLLIDSGANLDLQTTGGDTALILALKRNSYQAAKLLIDAGANIELENKEGNSAINFATGEIRTILEKKLEKINK